MHVHSLRIENYRIIKEATILFGDATFLIGENNSGKSTVLNALDLLFSARKKIDPIDYYCEYDTSEECNVNSCDEVVLEAEIRNMPREALGWRGFKGRVHRYDTEEDSSETGLRIWYRKTYKKAADAVPAIKSLQRSLKSEFERCNTAAALVEAGCPKEDLEEVYDDLSKNFTAKDKQKRELVDHLWNIDEGEEVWVDNPAGITPVVLSKLPGVLLIPAESSSADVSDNKKGALAKTMSQLFEDVRNQSENYKQAQIFLNNLAAELDPSDKDSQFGVMMEGLNTILNSVFPQSRITANADLSDPNKVLTPFFDIKMWSNVETPVEYQGTGLIRSAIFALLKYRQEWLSRREEPTETSSLIICFEEPEIYLHPNAANMMRDTIYDISGEGTQIVCSTHSPYMIDLSRKPRQILNSFQKNNGVPSINPFNVSASFNELQGDDQKYVKMLLKMDDYISRVFFAKKVIIIEGDTEDIVLRETIKRLPPEITKNIQSEVQIVKARGKGAIIPLVKYLNYLDIDIFVIHDRDGGTEGARKFNPHIETVLGADNKRIMLKENIEDVLGYPAPSSNKPFRAYERAALWLPDGSDIPQAWLEVVKTAFSEYFE